MARRRRTGLAVLAAAVALLAGSSPARAATIPVTTAADSTANDGQCSLREAVTAANENGSAGTAAGECPAGEAAGTDVIALQPLRYVLTRNGLPFEDINASGDLDVTGNVRISGVSPGTTILDGNLEDRVLDVLDSTPTPSVTLTDLTITRGRMPSEFAGSDPRDGGGIQSVAHLTLRRVVVTDNRARDASTPGASGGSGGGVVSIGSAATLTVEESLFTENYAGRGAQGFAGGPACPPGTGGPGGFGGDGGAIASIAGTLAVTNSTFASNFAGHGADGGSPGSADSMCGIPGPGSAGAGGDGGSGGGVSGSGTLTNVTFWGNRTGVEGNGASGMPTPGAGGSMDGAFTVRNSVMSSSSSVNCSGGPADAGGNITFGGAGCPGHVADPLLGPLQDLGGPTATLPLGAGSPAIDRGASDATCPATDQRGNRRPFGPGCDAGAYEVSPPEPPVLTGTDPSSPANDTMPRVRGIAEPWATVRLYRNPACTGALASQGTAAELASPGLRVVVPANSATTFYATATNATGTSGCSPSSITYVEGLGPLAFGVDTRVTIGLARKRIPARGPVRIVIRNQNGFGVTGRASGRSAPVRRQRGSARLPSKAFRVAARSRRTIKLRLPRVMRRALAERRRLSLRVAATVRDPSGNTRSVTRTLNPRLKPRRRR